jgi:hypothetical protein
LQKDLKPHVDSVQLCQVNYATIQKYGAMAECSSVEKNRKELKKKE